VAWIEEETGEIKKRGWSTRAGSEEFYAQFPRNVGGDRSDVSSVLVRAADGRVGHELWVGDAARLRASEVRLQKTDSRDAEHILDLLRTDRFPRIWVPSGRARPAAVAGPSNEAGAGADAGEESTARAGHQPGSVPEGQAVDVKGRKELESLALLPWAARGGRSCWRRWTGWTNRCRELDRAVEEAGREREGGGAVAHPSGSGHVVGLAFVLTVGRRAFPQQPQAGELLGLNPRENSSGVGSAWGPLVSKGTR